MTLRAEFEPVRISQDGCHFTARRCAEVWDQQWPEDDLIWQIAGATLWLRQFAQRQTINRRAGSSYHLKHAAESWLGKNGYSPRYVSNGCLLMAAHRLGFKFQPVEGHYCVARDANPPDGSVWDCHSAYLNISSRPAERVS